MFQRFKTIIAFESEDEASQAAEQLTGNSVQRAYDAGLEDGKKKTYKQGYYAGKNYTPLKGKAGEVEKLRAKQNKFCKQEKQHV